MLVSRPFSRAGGNPNPAESEIERSFLASALFPLAIRRLLSAVLHLPGAVDKAAWNRVRSAGSNRSRTLHQRRRNTGVAAAAAPCYAFGTLSNRA
jgi:hypothetical protein